jgi:hypothetical protein
MKTIIFAPAELTHKSNTFSVLKDLLLAALTVGFPASLAVGESEWDAKASGTLRKYLSSSKVCYNNVID